MIATDVETSESETDRDGKNLEVRSIGDPLV